MKTIKSILVAFTLLVATVSFGQNFKANHNTDDSKIALLGYNPSYVLLNSFSPFWAIPKSKYETGL